MVSGRFEIYRKNTIETVKKSLTDMFIRHWLDWLGLYPSLVGAKPGVKPIGNVTIYIQIKGCEVTVVLSDVI